MRGAWIEIFALGLLASLHLSLPVRGAWIEMKPCGFPRRAVARRSPCGERGLKCQEQHPVRQRILVAPRAGSVD